MIVRLLLIGQEIIVTVRQFDTIDQYSGLRYYRAEKLIISITAMSKRILIVEDEKPIANALKLKLDDLGFETVLAHNGTEGLKMVDAGDFSMILLDLVMPKMDGFEFLKELKKKETRIPVIVLTNLGQNDDESKVKELGAVGFFTKSKTTIKEIVERVEDFLS